MHQFIDNEFQSMMLPNGKKLLKENLKEPFAMDLKGNLASRFEFCKWKICNSTESKQQGLFVTM